MLARPLGFVLIILAIAGCSGGGSSSTVSSGAQDELRTGPFRMLVFTRTAGFRHASIEAGALAVQQLGDENGFSIDRTEDPALFTPDNLARYEAVMFLNTTLDVLDDEQQLVFEAYVRSGGGFVGVHSAADTEHDWPFYGELVGAYFLTHPVLNQPGTLRIETPEHPAVAHLPNPWMIPVEEYYSFETSPRGEVRVLMNINEDSYGQTPNISCDPSGPTFPQGFSGTMGDHPMSWCHDKFAGRAWYTALGHESYLYSLPDFRQHLLNGILTATRRVEASCAVNARPAGVPAFDPPELEACQNLVLP